MTTPGTPRKGGGGAGSGQRASEPATLLSVPIGPLVLEVLELAYRARRPVLLEGPTGIGKSQIVGELARSSGLDLIILDLSLLEPPDLIGLPVIEGGRTRYASPAELPTGGRGLLMLEELNRAETPVMQPALQLLSARRLHAYELPPGWSCVAAINPEDGDYQVNRLDPALRSRFLQVAVGSDRESWLAWAARANVHPVITGVVRDHVDAFRDASPRSWAYASDILHALRADEGGRRELVRVALRGYLPTAWSLAVTEALAGGPPTPDLGADVLLAPHGAAELARLVRELDGNRRTDAITMMAARLRRILAGDELAARAASGAVTLDGLEALLAALPGDLREQCLDSAVESPAAAALARGLGVDAAAIARGYPSSAVRAELVRWRKDARLHRVRLVVVAVQRWLDATYQAHADPAALAALVPSLSALITDAGPVAADLARWLRARDLVPEASPR